MQVFVNGNKKFRVQRVLRVSKEHSQEETLENIIFLFAWRMLYEQMWYVLTYIIHSKNVMTDWTDCSILLAPELLCMQTAWRECQAVFSQHVQASCHNYTTLVKMQLCAHCVAVLLFIVIHIIPVRFSRTLCVLDLNNFSTNGFYLICATFFEYSKLCFVDNLFQG